MKNYSEFPKLEEPEQKRKVKKKTEKVETKSFSEFPDDAID